MAIVDGLGCTGTGDANTCLDKREPTLRISPSLCANYAIRSAFVFIPCALVLTHFIPGRFQIHPLPYISDAGLRDPERIVLAIGTLVVATLLLPVVLAHNLRHAELCRSKGRLIRAELGAGVGTVVFLALFGLIPGWWLPHHFVSGLFALCAAAWTGLGTRAEAYAWVGCGSGQALQTRKKLYLGAIVVVVIVVFSCLWVSVRAGIPPMTPNKDKRFTAMALLEYVGILCFASYVHLVGQELEGSHVVVSSPS